MGVEYKPGTTGAVDDVVTLTLGGEELLVAESYEVTTSILTQPTSFALRLGHGTLLPTELANKAQPNTPFQLRIGGVLQATGTIDGIEIERGENGSELNIRGRDSLACLHDSYIEVEKNFPQHSYVQFVQAALDAVGFKGKLLTKNAKNREQRAGVPITVSYEPNSQYDDLENGIAFQPIQVKVGERFGHAVKRELDRAGLMLWSAANGDAVLSRPNPDQSPTFAVDYQRGASAPSARVPLSARFRNESTPRFSSVIAYGRYGGKKYGPAKAKGVYVDDEMTAWGYKRPFVLHDVHISSADQADFLASRKLAETRRQGWQLEYTFAGHSVPQLNGGQKRAVWTPDTVISVLDEDLGFDELFWIESVTFRRGPETTTSVVLMRKEDLLFGLE